MTCRTHGKDDKLIKKFGENLNDIAHLEILDLY
jgi:hypothetical protein